MTILLCFHICSSSLFKWVTKIPEELQMTFFSKGPHAIDLNHRKLCRHFWVGPAPNMFSTIPRRVPMAPLYRCHNLASRVTTDVVCNSYYFTQKGFISISIPMNGPFWSGHRTQHGWQCQPCLTHSPFTPLQYPTSVITQCSHSMRGQLLMFVT